MMVPTLYKPKVTSTDLAIGSMTRYFTKFVSSRTVVEIDANQYKLFINEPYYQTIKLPWVVSGNMYTTKIGDTPVLSIEDQNKKIVDFYEKQLPGLSRKLKNLMEYAQPTMNTP